MEPWLWLNVAVYCEPKGALRVGRLSKAIRAEFEASSVGSGLLAKYWYMLHHEVVWGRQNTDKKKLLLAFALSRSDAKKDWRSMYKDEHAAELRRTCRGMGCDESVAKEAIHRTSQAKRLNEFLPSLAVNESATPASTEFQKDAFEQLCDDGGAAQLSGERAEKTASWKAGQRRAYKSMKNAKVNGKHERGQEKIWVQFEALARDAWDADHEYR